MQQCWIILQHVEQVGQTNANCAAWWSNVCNTDVAPTCCIRLARALHEMCVIFRKRRHQNRKTRTLFSQWNCSSSHPRHVPTRLSQRCRKGERQGWCSCCSNLQQFTSLEVNFIIDLRRVAAALLPTSHYSTANKSCWIIEQVTVSKLTKTSIFVLWVPSITSRWLAWREHEPVLLPEDWGGTQRLDPRKRRKVEPICCAEALALHVPEGCSVAGFVQYQFFLLKTYECFTWCSLSELQSSAVTSHKHQENPLKFHC